MKLLCPKHGAHFGDEKEAIVNCSVVWRTMGMQRLPKAARRKLVDWMTAAPFDEIYIEFGWQIIQQLQGRKAKSDEALAKSPKYRNMTDAQRRAYQKRELMKKVKKQERQSWKNRILTKLGY